MRLFPNAMELLTEDDLKEFYEGDNVVTQEINVY